MDRRANSHSIHPACHPFPAPHSRIHRHKNWQAVHTAFDRPSMLVMLQVVVSMEPERLEMVDECQQTKWCRYAAESHRLLDTRDTISGDRCGRCLSPCRFARMALDLPCANCDGDNLHLLVVHRHIPDHFKRYESRKNVVRGYPPNHRISLYLDNPCLDKSCDLRSLARTFVPIHPDIDA
jgi:hypothetical protein